LLGTGIGSVMSRRIAAPGVRAATVTALTAVIAVAALGAIGLSAAIDVAVPWPLPLRVATAVALLVPVGVLLGTPLPSGMRLVADAKPDLIPWGWGMNGAFSVVGATAAIFIAMNWGFSSTLSAGALVYGIALAAVATRK
jgi:hypothetical protein